MRWLLAAVLLCGCAATNPPVAPIPGGELTVPTNVPNGRVEVVIQRTYPIGQPVRVPLRLLPASGTLRGPLSPFIEASGFAHTAVVKRLGATPILASAGSVGRTELVWDTQDEDGTPVIEDDYTLVFEVEDDQGRRTSVGATRALRGASR